VFGISLGAFVVLGLPDGMLGSAWPFMRSSFRQPLAALGLVQLAAMVGYLAASGLSGRVTRRIGRATMLLLAAAAGCVAALGIAATPWWWTLVVAAGVLGAAGGAVDAGMNAFLAHGDATRRLNLLHSCYGVGATVGPILVTRLVLVGAGWSAAYGVLCGLELAVAVAVVTTRSRWTTREEARGATGEHEHAEKEDGRAEIDRRDAHVDEAPARAAPVLSSRPVVFSLATFFVYTGAEVAAGQWSFTVLTTGRGLSTATAGALVAGYWGSLTLGRLVAAVIATRTSAAGLVRASVVGAVGGAGLFWWNPANPVGAAGLIVLGFSLAAVFPTMVGQTPGWSGSAHAPTVIGWQLASAGAGGALLSAVAGVVMQAAGLGALGPFVWATTGVLAVLYLVSRRIGLFGSSGVAAGTDPVGAESPSQRA